MSTKLIGTILVVGLTCNLTSCNSSRQHSPARLLKITESYYLLDEFDEAEAALAKIPQDSPQYKEVENWRDKITQTRESQKGIKYNRTRTVCWATIEQSSEESSEE